MGGGREAGGGWAPRFSSSPSIHNFLWKEGGLGVPHVGSPPLEGVGRSPEESDQRVLAFSHPLSLSLSLSLSLLPLSLSFLLFFLTTWSALKKACACFSRSSALRIWTTPSPAANSLTQGAASVRLGVATTLSSSCARAVWRAVGARVRLPRPPKATQAAAARRAEVDRRGGGGSGWWAAGGSTVAAAEENATAVRATRDG